MTDVLSRLLSSVRKGRVPIVLQSEAQECGHACLTSIAQYYGAKVTIQDIRNSFVPSTRGTSVGRLIKIAHVMGFHARAYRAEPVHLAQLTLPCVLHWDVMHFVVLERCVPGSFDLVDPACGRVAIGESEFSRRFTGIVIELEPGTDFKRSRSYAPSNALSLLRLSMRGVMGTLLSTAALALMLEALALFSPLFIQGVTDSIIRVGDTRLLIILTVAFAVAALLQTAISLARSALLIRLGAELTVGWNTTICGRLLRLPYVFFVRRSIGDINSRFASIDAIQRTLTHRFVEGALDGITAILSLAMIMLYSRVLALITIGATLIYMTVRTATFSRVRAAEQEGICVQAKQQSLLLEILHGIHSIKANGFEENQLARYNARSQDTARANASVQRWQGVTGEVGILISRLNRVLTIGAGAALAIRGDITAGMLIAYLTYAMQFSDRSSRLVDLVSDWKMLLLHCDRLWDIVSTQPKVARGSEQIDPDNCELEIQNLRFRYNQDEPWILDKVALVAKAGECIAIKGRSGSGKSTLAKLIIGMLDPDEGEIRINGKPTDTIGNEELRSNMACVLQDDQLFNGTIAENIAFFEPNYDRERIVAAAISAQMHAEIMDLPVGYDTKVIDMGASLSGGQRQRLILARALYRQPKILVLDEASSHLDLKNERGVNDAISKLRITRVIIAHRPETLAIADRVFELSSGKLTEVSAKSGLAEFQLMGA